MNIRYCQGALARIKGQHSLLRLPIRTLSTHKISCTETFSEIDCTSVFTEEHDLHKKLPHLEEFQQSARQYKKVHFEKKQLKRLNKKKEKFI